MWLMTQPVGTGLRYLDLTKKGETLAQYCLTLGPNTFPPFEKGCIVFNTKLEFGRKS